MYKLIICPKEGHSELTFICADYEILKELLDKLLCTVNADSYSYTIDPIREEENEYDEQ